MSGRDAADRGAHTGSGSEAAAIDLDGYQRKSLVSNLDFGELVRLQIPPASGISEYVIFDRDDGRAVHGSLCSFTKLFEQEKVRDLIDVFVKATAPSVGEEELKKNTRKIEIADKKFTISGPRGGQYPQEVATLHEQGVDQGGEVCFVAPTATLLLLFKAGPGADVQYQSNEKQGIWAAIRSFASSLSEKGL